MAPCLTAALRATPGSTLCRSSLASARQPSACDDACDDDVGQRWRSRAMASSIEAPVVPKAQVRVCAVPHTRP
eukprot:scaffold65493_cov63-Phaeocystis_antarctica.AAC.3